MLELFRCCRLDTVVALFYIGIVKEIEKQKEKAKIERERPVDVSVGHIASVASILGQQCVHVHPDADHHLKELQASDENVNELRNGKTGCSKCIVRVHN